MLNSFVKIINCAIEFVFVVNCLGIVQIEKKEKNTSKRGLFYFVAYVAVCCLLNRENYRFYILKNVWRVFCILLFNQKLRNNNKINIICVIFCIYEFTNLISIISSVIVVSFFEFLYINTYRTMIVVAYIVQCLFLYLIWKKLNEKCKENSWLENPSNLVCIFYMFIVCIKIPFLYTEIRDALALKMVVLTILCCTVIFLIISGIDKHNAQKERERIEENNKKLSSRLHKSQEILPAMVQVLSHVTENGGTEMETQKAQELLAEVNDLYGRQLRENSEEDLQLKNFCSTGLKMLDQQLKVYQMEAIDRNVNLDIFVQAPINDLIKKDGIDQWRLQRAVGDLVRNAFRAVEKEDKKCRANKHILLIIGCRYEGILEVAVVDNGTEFPLHVIEAFGKRGVTTGGTGNGLADLVEFADDMGASISVDEFDGRTSLFTKRVSISFDKQRKNNFNSVRKEFVGGSFWNIW